jgi:hypothetical protein
MEEQIKAIREAAANKYKNKPTIKIQHTVSEGIPHIKYLFIKNNSYYIKLDNIIKIEDICHLSLYSQPRSLSEFGKSFNKCYIKSTDGKTYLINAYTYLLPFSDTDYYSG